MYLHDDIHCLFFYEGKTFCGNCMDRIAANQNAFERTVEEDWRQKKYSTKMQATKIIFRTGVRSCTSGLFKIKSFENNRFIAKWENCAYKTDFVRYPTYLFK